MEESGIKHLGTRAREVSRHLALLSTAAKNEIILMIADSLEEQASAIVAANKRDMEEGEERGLSSGLLDRLLLTEERIAAIAASARKVAMLDDPVGKVLESRTLDNNLLVQRVRVPLGVIAMIYEARPNVTVDASVLALKSGNAVILKGGSDALHSNQALVRLIQKVLREATGTEPETHLENAVQLVETKEREATAELLTMREYIDVVIPRGSAGLISFVRDNATIPVIETGASVVHTYIHSDADLGKAVPIILNEKLRRVSVCNTLDTLLINRAIAPQLLEALVKALPSNPYNAPSLQLRADAESYTLIEKALEARDLETNAKDGGDHDEAEFNLELQKATGDDYSTEFLDYVLAIKQVADLDEALEHIRTHSLRHSEAIITEDEQTARRFLNEVDAACVYWNASTQFTDGEQLGLGAEIGISTQKLHVRGPFALEGLTSYKWIIQGGGQIRP